MGELAPHTQAYRLETVPTVLLILKLAVDAARIVEAGRGRRGGG